MRIKRFLVVIGLLLILTLVCGCLAGCGETTSGTVTLNDGSTYVGQLKYDVPWGKGTQTFSNGNKYTGQFKNGQMEGKGKFTWANGEWYVGDFEDGAPNGKGKLYKMKGKWIADVTAKNGALTIVGTPIIKANINVNKSSGQ